MKSTVGMGPYNSDSFYDDFIFPMSVNTQNQKQKKPSVIVCYCTSHMCNRPPPGRENETSGVKKKLIEKPPKSGWCPYCGNALFYEEKVISSDE